MERRLAAILAVDVVGYSRLMGKDEVGTHAGLQAHRRELFDPKVAEHKGRIVKYTGDGALVEFASVVNALECAFEFQNGMSKRNANLPEDSRITFRVGINLGDIIVEAEDIYGDGVNVAARLETLAEPGGICIAQNVFDQVRNKFDLGFEDLGEQRLKNIADPVRAYRVQMDPNASGIGKDEAVYGLRGPQWALIAAVILTLFVSGGLLWWQPWSPIGSPISVEDVARPLSAKPSIAVLPFDNMSDKPNLDYFGHGVTEDIITELARSAGLLVASRTSSFAYREKTVTAQDVARELGVQYVLEGSVRKEAQRVRITAQLVDGRTGHHVWAERLDEEGSDIFDLQDSVTRKIIATLSGATGQIRKAASVRAWQKDTASLEEYDYYLRGHAIFYRFTQEAATQAREIWLEGLKKFPKSGLLRIKVGWSYFQEVRRGWSTAPKKDLALAFKLAKEGLADERLPPVGQWYGHWLMSGLYLWHSRDYQGAVNEAELTFALVPNDSESLAFLTQVPLFAGEHELAMTWINKAIALEPEMPTWFYRYLGWASFLRGEYQRAVDQLEKMTRRDLVKFQLLTASYSRLGRMEDAKATVREMRNLDPEVSITGLRELLPYRDKSVLENLLADLREAGVPE